MTNANPELKIGDPIPGEKVNPNLTIRQILDKPIGHLLIDRELGNIHAYWYQWVKEREGKYRKVLKHHGGPEGFDDIQTAIDQHQAVIGRYMGYETEVPKDEEETETLKPPFTLRTYATALRIGVNTLEVPGEQAWVMGCLIQVERVIRGAAVKMPASDLQLRMAHLSVLQRRFDVSQNPYMQSASTHLLQAVEASKIHNRDETMVALLQMGGDLTKRVGEIGKILTHTIQRDSILESLRNSMEGVVGHVHREVLWAKEKWDTTEDDGIRQRIISNLVREGFGVRRFAELTVQPFRGRAEERELARLARLGEFWDERDFDLIGRVLTDGSRDLSSWVGKNKKRVDGEQQIRFPTIV